MAAIISMLKFISSLWPMTKFMTANIAAMPMR